MTKKKDDQGASLAMVAVDALLNALGLGDKDDKKKER